MVAALADHSNPKRRVWVDVLAVRQWPGNAAVRRAAPLCTRGRLCAPRPLRDARASPASPPIASRQDLCFSKVVSKCTSFVIVSQAFETTKRNNLTCLGDLSPEQMRARQTHLLPLIVQKSISYLRIWVRPRRRPAPHSPDRRRRRP